MGWSRLKLGHLAAKPFEFVAIVLLVLIDHCISFSG
jgi:hypothetical protein